MFSGYIFFPYVLKIFNYLYKNNKIVTRCLTTSKLTLTNDLLVTLTSAYGLQVFFALTMAAMGISQSSSFAPDSTKAKSAAASIFSIVDRKSKIDPSEESGMKLDDVKGEIELRHVSFTYPSRPDIQIFRDLCLTIHSGKVKFSDTLILIGLYFSTSVK
jgi:ABC-type multidrug transport system fused ATPase/permease subunit